jgi:hypothetical protein
VDQTRPFETMQSSKSRKPLPPHPATVVRPRAAPQVLARPAHAATLTKPTVPPRAAQRAPHPAAVVQRASRVTTVSAYRLERSSDAPKITNVSKGKLNLSAEAHEEGLSISFTSDEHANYFYEKHGGSLITLAISKKAYEEIQNKLTKKSAKVGGKSLSAPSPCSDAVMKNLEISPKNVLTFGSDWAEYLEEHMTVISVRKKEEGEEDD